jgi:hypothetical protein
MEVLSLPLSTFRGVVEGRLSPEKEEVLNEVQRRHFNYFQDFIESSSGLVFDRSTSTAPISIAATGFSLSAYIVAWYRHWISTDEATDYFHKVINSLIKISPQVTYRGWWSHFIDPHTLLPARKPKYWDSEYSTIDTALLLWGILSVATIANVESESGRRLKSDCLTLLSSIDWSAVLDDQHLFHHGFCADKNLLRSVYRGYSEALLLYILALGLDVDKLPSDLWQCYLRDYTVINYHGNSFVTMPGTPLFCYEYPHCWIDFRGIYDHVNSKSGFDYFVNSGNFVKAQITYAKLNPCGFKGYDNLHWGISASDGPGWCQQNYLGKVQQFWGYYERGAPFGNDDGTICPTAQLAALPFLPEVVWNGVQSHIDSGINIYRRSGFTGGYNLTYRTTDNQAWVDDEMVGIDNGAAILMIENYRSGLIWSLCMQNSAVKRGLIRAGFSGLTKD